MCYLEQTTEHSNVSDKGCCISEHTSRLPPAEVCAFCPLLAFGWVSSGMLVFLFAAAAPLLIHLWNRRRYQETPWAAIEYLLAAVQQSRRRIRLEQLLLLFLRTFLIVLVVVAAAGPYFERSGAELSISRPLHHLLVIDDSYSMAYRPTDKTLFEQAKTAALQILKQAKKGDVFTILTMSGKPRLETIGNTEPEAAIRKLLHLQIAHASADLPATVAAAAQAIKEATRLNPNLAGHRVYFFSDFQRATWRPELSAGSRADLLRQVNALAQQASLVLIDFGSLAAENLAIVELKTSASLILVGQETVFEAQLRNFGRQARINQTIDLLVDGRRVAREVVDVPPGKAVEVKFAHRFMAPDEQAIEVSAPGDALEIDNHHYLVVQVREKLRVLCIDGRPTDKPFQGAADYVAAALALPDAPPESTLFQVETAEEGALLERNLSEYDCIFLCDVAQFTPEEVQLFDSYLQHGGGLIFFLGNQTLPERYNRDLAVARGGRKANPERFQFLPARIGSLVEQPQTRLNAFEFRHPLLAVFRSRGERGLLTTPVFKYYKLFPHENPQVKTVLALSNGEPLLLEHLVHRGHVLLFATAAEPSWSGLPLWPSFVPLLQEITLFCVADSGLKRNVQVGEPLELFPPTATAEMKFTVLAPDGSKHPVRPRLAGEHAATSFSDTRLSGIYQFRPFSPQERTSRFAVNVDTRESDLSKVSESELREEIWPDVGFRCETSWEKTLMPGKQTLTLATGVSIPLLYLTVMFLAIETFAAWRLSRQGKG